MRTHYNTNTTTDITTLGSYTCSTRQQAPTVDLWTYIYIYIKYMSVLVIGHCGTSAAYGGNSLQGHDGDITSALQ